MVTVPHQGRVGGFGCWAIGGPFGSGGKAIGWGVVNDDESVAAIRRAIELGITFFDTSDVYGVGHSERVLGRAITGCRDDVVVSTKFGYTFDESTRQLTGANVSDDYIRAACDASLHRLGTDRIDLYLLHDDGMAFDRVDGVIAVLESLVAAGKIRSYGWSTDDPAGAATFAVGPHCAATQYELNLLDDQPEMLAVCAEHGMAGINRGPLAMGLLSGKYTADSRLGEDDVRGNSPSWMRYFRDSRPAPEWLDRMAAVREVLTSGGRTLAQGALGWLLARADTTIPIPGIRTVAQATENAGALVHGPLDESAMADIERLLRR
ncbi:MAG TPA: aldo/keto reductase [Pseudonocardiaceae bacterium]|jgi:aryl-alcohol dehydrogenase-like predicted oxidoreductase|nr:aldo/keto reductase [Pseudonocardiaceae bacterium]